jgi:hypothetical protein
MIIKREDIHLGSYFHDYIMGQNTDYSEIKEYVRFLNDIIFYIETGEENTRNQDMGYINGQLLEPEYIKHTYIPALNVELSKLKSNEMTKKNFREIMNSVLFELNERIFQFDLFEFIDLYFDNEENLEGLSAEFNNMYQKNSHFYINHLVEYTKKRNSSSLNREKLKKYILPKTNRIYKIYIPIWMEFIKRKRDQLKEYIAPLPRDLYQNISMMMGVPELSKSPLQKTKSTRRSNIKTKTRRQR